MAAFPQLEIFKVEAVSALIIAKMPADWPPVAATGQFMSLSRCLAG